MLKVTTLMENQSSRNRGLVNTHGLSFYIEFNGKNYLFDFGYSGIFMENAFQMGVEFDDIEALMISHSHFDHAGGFKHFIKEGYNCKKLYMGNGFFDKKYNSIDGIKYSNMGAGFTENYLRKNNINYEFIEDITEVDKDFYIVSDFERKYDFETIPTKFVKETENGIVPDDFSDEIALVFRTEKGLVVLVGCSHPGILNMLSKISKRFNEKIYGVFGGTHLVEANSSRVEKTVEIAKNMGVEILGLCHCSGEEAEEEIKKDKEVKSCHLAVGDSLIVG